MRNLFSEDNPFNQFMTLLFDLFLLNLLCLLTSLPIFTIGASSTALYTVMLKRTRNEEGYVIRGYFKAFRANFRQSLLPTVIFLGTLVILFADLLILRGWEGSAASLMYGFCVALFAAVMAVYGYVWPLLAMFENTTGNLFNNAWRLALAKLPWTLLILLLNVLPLLLFLTAPGIFARVFWLWLLIGFSLAAYLISRILNPVFEELIGGNGGNS